MTTFFSVDVETTSAKGPYSGQLLSVGIVPVRDREILQGSFYWGLSYTGLGDPDTMKWWGEQDKEVKDAAFGFNNTDESLATAIYWWTLGIEPVAENRIFVANPVAFDKKWIDDLFEKTRQENPFHYRSLCLRSMSFGLHRGQEWGKDRTENISEVPHHALHDAKAQAIDLISLLKKRDG